MKGIRYCARLVVLMLLATVLFGGLVCPGQDKPKLKGEDIRAKHIASIGSADAITAAMNRKIEGSAQVRNVRIAQSLVRGGSFLASAKDKHVLVMAFQALANQDYAGERIGYDGKDVNIPFVSAAQRSAVGSFIFAYPEIIKHYFFGGTLFSSWALTDPHKHIGKFELQGTEKIGDVETYKIRVVPKGGTTLNIRMFFDATSFRHLRTEYKYTATAGTVTVDEGRATESRYTLTEDFSNYKTINELSLPTTYKVTMRVDSARQGLEFEWLINLSRFAFDKTNEPEIFRPQT